MTLQAKFTKIQFQDNILVDRLAERYGKLHFSIEQYKF